MADSTAREIAERLDKLLDRWKQRVEGLRRSQYDAPMPAWKAVVECIDELGALERTHNELEAAWRAQEKGRV